MSHDSPRLLWTGGQNRPPLWAERSIVDIITSGAARTMSSREIARLADRISAIIDGSASEDEAMSVALSAVGLVAFPVQRLADFCAGREQGSDSDKIIDDAYSGRAIARSFASVLSGHYPYAASIVSSVVSACAYADATLVPCAVYLQASSQDLQCVKTYIVHSPASGLIKIGKSKDVVSRIRSLETGAGAKLSVLAVLDGDCESELHVKFAAIRRFGEWFADDGRIEAYARDVAAQKLLGGVA